jgi:hypothetical protein
MAKMSPAATVAVFAIVECFFRDAMDSYTPFFDQRIVANGLRFEATRVSKRRAGRDPLLHDTGVAAEQKAR